MADPPAAKRPMGSWMPSEIAELAPPPEAVTATDAEPAPEAAAEAGPGVDLAAQLPLNERDEPHREAVITYCRTLLEPPVDAEAASDALAAFEQARRASDAGPPADDLLRAVTRLMVAVSLPDRSAPADRRKAVRASIGARSHCTCREAPALMATRANGTISDHHAVALSDHLSECEACRGLADRIGIAEARLNAVLSSGATESES